MEPLTNRIETFNDFPELGDRNPRHGTTVKQAS